MASMTDSLDPQVLLSAYDSQLRATERFGESAIVTWDGPARRVRGLGETGFLEYRDLGGLEGPELDAFIARQIAYFSGYQEKFEWKTRGHDRPADLPDRLLAAGFEPEPAETVVIGRADSALKTKDIQGVRLRETADSQDFDEIAAMNTVAWGEDLSWLSGMLGREAGSPNFKVYVAEADGKIVSAAWIRLVPGTGFAGLWGGTTLAEYRGRGIYKALVAIRAEYALEHGHHYLQVDCTEDSRPILERLGFVAVTTTTPYIWRP
jgi:ribosomal protein S18 acetylase RimI-like enzyme